MARAVIAAGCKQKAAADGQHSRGRTDHRYRPAERRAAGLLGSDLVPADEAAGYRIQRAVHDLLLPQAGSLVGYKIGCTSPVMQHYLGIPHPCAGGVFEKGVHDSGAGLRPATMSGRRRMRDRGAARAQPVAARSAVHRGMDDGGDRGLSSRDRDRRRPLRQMGDDGRADARRR